MSKSCVGTGLRPVWAAARPQSCHSPTGSETRSHTSKTHTSKTWTAEGGCPYINLFLAGGLLGGGYWDCALDVGAGRGFVAG